VFHHLADMLYVEASSVEGTVGRSGAQYFADRLHSAFAGRVCAFDHKARSAHSHDQAVPTTVKGSSSFFDHLVCGGRTARQKSSTEPFNQMVRSNIVGRNNDYAAAPSGVDPVLRKRHCLRGA